MMPCSIMEMMRRMPPGISSCCACTDTFTWNVCCIVADESVWRCDAKEPDDDEEDHHGPRYEFEEEEPVEKELDTETVLVICAWNFNRNSSICAQTQATR